MSYEYDEEPTPTFARIEVIVGDIDYDLISNAIVNKIDKRMMEKIQNAMEKAIETKIEEITEKVISDAIEGYIEGNLTLKAIQFDEFGRKTKEELSPLDIIMNRAKSYINENVDYNGNKSTGSYDTKQSRLDYLTQSTIDRKFESELSATTAAMKKEVGDKLKTDAVKWLADFQATVRKTIGGAILNP
jgi:methionine aminopeptidase